MGILLLGLLLAVLGPAHAAELTVVSALTRGNPNAVTVAFSAPVELAGATNAANYSIAPGIVINSVSPITSAKVRLHTSLLPEGRVYTLTVNGVRDLAEPANSIAPNTQRLFFQTEGGITRREFHDIGGGLLSDLTSHAKFTGNKPDATAFTLALETPADARENYGVQFLGYVTAPVTGDYTFYVNSDDQGALFLSSDDIPANKVQIAAEPQWNGSRGWVSGGNAASRYPNPPDAFFAGALFIEAEDFDFGGGQFMAEAAAGMSGPYAGGAYAGKGASADAGFDWRDGDPANQGGGYRPATGVDIGPQSGSQDLSRGSFAVRENFAVGWCDPGDWMNYTRAFPLPARTYHVFARMSSAGADIAARLDEVTAGAGTAEQTLVELGKFYAPATGDWGAFAFVPLRNAANEAARVSLGGQGTLRFTTLPGNLNIDYLLFAPAGPGEPDLRAPRPANMSAPIRLEAGRRYFIEAQMKEAGGGDNLAVTWRKPGDSAITNGTEPIPGEFLSGVEPLTPASIVAQPRGQTVNDHGAVTFTVALEGAPPHDFQWYRDGEMLAGEEGPELTLTAVSGAFSGSTFHVICGNGLNSLRSAGATLTVIPDLTPPQLVFAEGRASLDEAGVGFSEPIDSADAADLSRYQISGGLTLLGATLWPNGRLVILKTSLQTPGQSYTVTVNGIRDRATSPNSIATGSQLSFTGFDPGLPVSPAPPGYQRVTVATRAGPVTVVIPRREFHFEPAGRTYYLAANGDDADPGSLEQPWRTFAHSLNQMQPGDLLYARAGDYPEPFVASRSGALGKPIILSAYPGESVRILFPSSDYVPPAGAHGANTVQLDGSHIWIHGFEIIGPSRELGHRPLGTPVLSAIQLGNGGEGCRILNNILHRAQYCGIKDQTGSVDYLVEGNISFDNATPIDGAFPHGAGMYLPGPARTGTIVRGNAFFHNGAGGFSHYHRPAHHHFYNNLSFGNGVEAASFGVVASGHRNRYLHNVIADNNAWGFSFYEAAGEGQPNDNLLANSIITGRPGQWLLDQGYEPPNGNTVAFMLLHPSDRWATHESRLNAILGPGISFGDPRLMNPRDGDFRARSGSPARWSANPEPMLGARPQMDIGLFPATEYWEPELQPISDVAIAEGSQLHFTVRLANSNPPSQKIRFLLAEYPPSGAAIHPVSGEFTWTPDEFQGGSSYRITVIAQADDSPVVYAARTFTVHAAEGNRVPLLGLKTSATNSLLASADLREIGAPGSPGATEAASANGYRLTAHGGGIIRDKGWTDLIRFAYTEVHGDFDARVRVEGLTSAGVFTGAGIMAREALDPASQMLFAFVTPAGPTEQGGMTGMNAYSVNFRFPSGDWRRPAIEASPNVPFPNAWIRLNRQGNSFRAYRSNNGADWIDLLETTALYSPSIYLGLAVDAARWETAVAATAEFRDFEIRFHEPKPVNAVTAEEGTALSLPFMAADPDRPGQKLAFSLAADSAVGAAIDPESGVFTWTPPESAGGRSFAITVRVADDGAPPLSIDQTFTVAVNEVNHPPIIDAPGDKAVWAGKPLSLAVAASDPKDIPANNVSLAAGDLPPGAIFDPVTGMFSWTPARDQGGVHQVTFTATDDGFPPLSAAQTITLAVAVNNPPVLTAIPEQTIAEGTALRLDLRTPDVGGAPGILREVFDGINGVSVADLSNSVRFPKQPSGSSVRTAFEAPRDIGDNYGQRMRGFITPPETGEYTFWIASDDASILKLSPNALPAGAKVIASVSGWTDFRQWTREPNQRSAPLRLEAGMAYYIEALMKEGGGGDHLSVRWQLPNGALETPIPRTRLLAWAKEPEFFAADSDVPAQTLSYSLAPNAPAGAAIDPVTGVLFWRPGEEQGPGAHDIAVRVTDNGEPAMTSEETLRVIVKEVNSPPVLAPIPAQSSRQGARFTLTPSASDADLPANKLTWELGAEAPAGMELDPATGAISWRPDKSQGGRTYPVSVTVTDDGAPPLSDTAAFTVEVTGEPKAPRIAGFGLTEDGRFQLSWESEPGGRYRMEFKSSHRTAEWARLEGEIVADGPITSYFEPFRNDAERYFRVVLVE